MEVVVLADAQEIGGVAADAIASLLDRKPAAVLGLATGSSPLAIYDELAARGGAGALSLPRGIAPSARRCSYPGWTSPLGVPRRRQGRSPPGIRTPSR